MINSNNNFANINSKSGLDGIKTQLMSLFMFKSSTSSSTDDGSSFYTMIYSILILTVIDNLMACIPVVVKIVSAYVTKNVSEIKILESYVESSKTITSSLVVDINLSKNEDYFGDAVLDHITNSSNVKNILFSNKRFILSSKEPVLVDEQKEIYFKLISESKTTENSATQMIEIYSYLLNMVELRIFVDSITSDYKYKIQNKLGGKIFYFDEMNLSNSQNQKNLFFTMKEFVTNRTFDNVVGNESKSIRKRVNFFKNNKKWYDDKGIPYTLGLLLSGPPGGGKTSTIKCVANTMGRHIINVKIHDKLTKSQMEHLFFNDVLYVNRDGISERFQIPIDKRIYVFEDVDCHDDENNLVLDRAQKEKNGKVELEKREPQPQLVTTKTQVYKAADNATVENTPPQEKLTLSGLLNIMDGILETPGRIIIMTSNYPERLDGALIRPGRIDLKIEFPYCDAMMIIDLIEKFYDVSLSNSQKDEFRACKLKKSTPAEITKILFENFEDYLLAIKQIIQDCDTKNECDIAIEPANFNFSPLQ